MSINRGGHKLFLLNGLKIKKTINSKNDDGNCFQYAITLALYHEQFKRDPQRMTAVRSFISQYEWKVIKFLPLSKDGET